MVSDPKRMLFSIGEKIYTGESAVDIVDALKFDMPDGEQRHLSVREFILWSMSQLSDRIPLRELDVSDKLSNEMLALNYLLLRDEYGAGTLSDYMLRQT
ncbi:MAG TPA: hypothetical protein VJM50_04635 [Pyrinomonadaceae bacterium]|nr:hypothetical protein [Pyrinomonadaceae bacterium]